MRFYSAPKVAQFTAELVAHFAAELVAQFAAELVAQFEWNIQHSIDFRVLRTEGTAERQGVAGA